MRALAVAFAALAVSAALGGCFGDAPPDAMRPSPPSVTTTPTGGTPLPPPPPSPRDPRLALEPVASGFDRPLLVTHAGDGSGRLFVVEQGGLVKVVRDGRVEEAPFLDLTDRVLAGGERGLLGLAFHPRFEENRRVFASYTDRDGATVLAEYAALGTVADAATERVLLTEPQPYANHNGGHVAFGPDGFLYLGLGDGGAAGDPGNRAQDLGTLLGKMLRLDVDDPGGVRPAPGNPFLAEEGARAEIWAYGLRNPWRWSFDRATGDLWIADVGQNAVEEVDFQPASSGGGENYGWNVWEGSRRYRPGDTRGPSEPTFPVAEYARADGDCSVTGGYVVQHEDAGSLVGVFLHGDYCSGRIRGVWAEEGEWRTGLLLDTELRISSFGEDEAGRVYVVDHGGRVLRVVPK